MEVEVTATVEVPRRELMARLEPESIMAYAGDYEVVGSEEAGGKRVLRVRIDDLAMAVEFTELEDGYAYRQRADDGPFAEMRTWITVDGDGETVVTARTEYTFGGVVWFLVDWLAIKYRRRELERLIANLVADCRPE